MQAVTKARQNGYRRNRFQNTYYYQRQIRLFYHDKSVNPPRIYKNYENNCTQQQSPKYIKQRLTDLKIDIDNSAVIIGDFNIPLLIMDRKTMQKMNKEIEDLDNAINQIDLTEIYQTLHATIAKYTFFSGVH